MWMWMWIKNNICIHWNFKNNGQYAIFYRSITLETSKKSIEKIQGVTND